MRVPISAAVGGALWLAVPVLPVGTPPSFASLEHGFLVMPLIAAPLALDVLAALLGLRYRIARALQPAGAAAVLVSFCIARGTAAGVLAAGWLLVALAVTAAGLRRAVSSPSLLAAHLFLPI